MKKINNSILRFGVVACLLCLQFAVSAQQPTSNSPYSRFGLGDLTNPNFFTTRSMGNLGSSYFNTSTINAVNPASYSFLNQTTYDVGIYAEYAKIKDNVVTEDKWSGNLDYIGIAFPLRNYRNEILDPTKRKYKLGMAFFIKPYSNVSYDIETTEQIAGSNDITRNFFGNGGTYSLSWGNAIRFSDFSVGLNLGYLFGKINNTQLITLEGAPESLTDNIVNEYNVSGLVYDLGFLYQLVLNKKALEKSKSTREKKVTFGLRGNLGSNFRTNGTFSHIGTSLVLVNLRDTVSYDTDRTESGKLPAVLGFGITYYDGLKISLGLDFEYGNWTNFSNDIRPDIETRNTMKVGLGGQYTPDSRGFGTFLERVNYQFGAYYHQDPRVIASQNINIYGLTFGMAMPFFYQQKFSKINVHFNAGQRGAGTIISENFIQMGLGFNFNDDSWFIKRKYN